MKLNRRQFIKNNGLALGALALPSMSGMAANFLFSVDGYVSNRPPLAKRTFISEAIERKIVEVQAKMADPQIAWMFGNCYPNTLDTTVDHEIIDGTPDTFIITGDIDAMWLRDSTAQVWPYLPLINEDENLKEMIKGLINRQVKCVLLDPYANAFYKDMTKVSDWNDDIPQPMPGVHERKWEIDSLCYVVRLSNRYFELTGDSSVFDADWDKAMRLIVQTFRTEQRMDGTSPYRFSRRTNAMIDAPVFNGTGRPIKPTGLICSMFRPSDDATLFPYLIPSNIFAELSLRQLASIYADVLHDAAFVAECTAFADEINKAVKTYGIAEHLGFGQIYAYEVDGFGNKVFMDDANVPSLMSLAYLDPIYASAPVYQRTRKFLLSNANPYYLIGDLGEGQASPHTGKEKIWPMGIILRAMTSNSPKEIFSSIKMLKNTHAETGFMHEAFHKDNPYDFNRAWFAWANTLFGELIIKVVAEYPEILAEAFD